MISYREAVQSDWENIALLHAKSWQENYRGSMSDDYLDNVVIEERKAVWEKRFAKPNEKQLIILAEENRSLIGLSCIFLESDPKYGALLDNLHVRSDYKRKGIGKILLKKSAKLLMAKSDESSLYLWVLTKNSGAIDFYEKVGGTRHDTKAWKTPDNRSNDTYRYVWNDLEKLSNLE